MRETRPSVETMKHFVETKATSKKAAIRFTCTADGIFLDQPFWLWKSMDNWAPARLAQILQQERK